METIVVFVGKSVTVALRGKADKAVIRGPEGVGGLSVAESGRGWTMLRRFIGVVSIEGALSRVFDGAVRSVAMVGS